MVSIRRSNPLLAAAILAGLAVIPSIGCTATSDRVGPPGADMSGLTYEEWKATVYKDPGGAWIVNGDTPIVTERKLRDFYSSYVQEGALIVHTENGVEARWDDQEKLNISYCVSSSFGGNYDRVVQAMDVAAGAWEAAANVDFVHDSSLDDDCTSSTQGVVFDVNPVDAGGQYLARAFFPNQDRSTRNVLIDGTAFGDVGAVSLEGILRHELGHTLGFRHEHTRPEAGTCFEDDNWKPLTDYDANSVMHYPQCNGANQGDLDLTDKDREGAASLYGAPGGGDPGNPGDPNDPGNPGDPSGGACAHDICQAGEALDGSCDPCVGQVVAADSYCGDTEWDSVCVEMVESVCGQSCGGGSDPSDPSDPGQPGGMCGHGVCEPGEALDPSCDPCAADVGAYDDYCVQQAWDDVCVDIASQMGCCQ